MSAGRTGVSKKEDSHDPAATAAAALAAVNALLSCNSVESQRAWARFSGFLNFYASRGANPSAEELLADITETCNRMATQGNGALHPSDARKVGGVS